MPHGRIITIMGFFLAWYAVICVTRTDDVVDTLKPPNCDDAYLLLRQFHHIKTDIYRLESAHFDENEIGRLRHRCFDVINELYHRRGCGDVDVWPLSIEACF